MGCGKVGLETPRGRGDCWDGATEVTAWEGVQGGGEGFWGLLELGESFFGFLILGRFDSIHACFL